MTETLTPMCRCGLPMTRGLCSHHCDVVLAIGSNHPTNCPQCIRLARTCECCGRLCDTEGQAKHCSAKDRANESRRNR